MNEHIANSIRSTINMVKKLKLDISEINNHLSILEGLCREDTQKKMEEAYQKGMDACEELLEPSAVAGCLRGSEEAWEAARKIGHASQMQLKEMGFEFNSNEWLYNPSWYVVMNYTAAEAIEKIKAYEEKQKADDEIKVGDEVAFHHDDGRPDTVVVVTYIGQDGFIDGMDGRGTQYAHKNPTKWTKTGRHFDIEEILDEMKRED